VYGVRSGPITAPSVVAFSASCSAKPTVAPRPETSDGSSAARVTGVAATAGAAAQPRVPMTAAVAIVHFLICSPSPSAPGRATL
jgi:hypothetical protein